MRRTAIVLTVVVLFGVVTPSLAVAAAPDADQAATADRAATERVSYDVQPAPIQPALKSKSGVVEVVVRLDSKAPTAADRETAISQLREQAAATQRDVLLYAKRTDGVAVVERFWLTNAVLLEVDKSKADLQRMASIRGVSRLHTNFEVQVPTGATPKQSGSAAERPASSNGYNTTYGVAQVNATEVWDAYGTRGEGVKVAVLDSGVDDEHPDINDSLSSFVRVDSEGNVVSDVEPSDPDGHGTHVSGTVVGENNSGQWIGVAPEATLMHGQVLGDGGGNFAAVVGGMQWAVNNSADVISMSLGCVNAPCYRAGLVEPVRNAQAAGTVVVAAAGNSGNDTSISPGNVFESIAVGASNDARGIASFSGGEVVDTDADWGSDAPADWPGQYVVPDAAAPGVDVCSSVPSGYSCSYSGTSMATPHVAGVVALMESAAGGDLSADRIKTALYETAKKPGDRPSNDTRYGAGIVDAKAATDQVALESGVNGTVTGPDGTPIADATVTASNGFSDTTDASGEYRILAGSGSLDVTADAFGYAPTTKTVTVPNGSFVQQNISLAKALEVEPQSGQPGAVAAGENVSVTVRAANVESLTVALDGEVDAANATLYVAGQEATFGEPVTFDGPVTGTVTVTVATSEGAMGTLSLVHTFEGIGETRTVTTGPTTVFEERVKVAVVDTPDGEFGGQVQSALADRLSARYQVDLVTSDELLDAVPEYDVFVVQRLPPGDEALAESFVDATSSPSKGVVYLDAWGFDNEADSNGIYVRSLATGDPASVANDYGGSSQPQYVQMDADHPLFDGVDASTPITIHQASFTDHVWFNGTDADVVAKVTDDPGEVSGNGLAVDHETNAVLAATLGREAFVGNEDFTAAADTILANAVTYTASQRPTIAGELNVTTSTVQPGETTELVVKTTADDVAGYQLNVSYNASRLQVTDVEGVDMVDPTVRVDNDAGYVRIAQAAATGTDSPTLVELTVEVVTDERGTTTPLTFANGTLLNDPNGTELLVTYDAGAVDTAVAAPGDVNEDGEVTSADATLVQRYIVGLPIEGTFNFEAADVNDDGQSTAADVTAILQIIVDGQPAASLDASQSVTAAA